MNINNLMLLLSPDNLGLWAQVCRRCAIATSVCIAYIIVGSLAVGLMEWAEWIPKRTDRGWGLINTSHTSILFLVPLSLVTIPIMAIAVAQYLEHLSGKVPSVGWLGRNLHVFLMLVAASQLLITLNHLVLTPYELIRLNAQHHREVPVIYNTLVLALTSFARALFYYGLSDLICRTRRQVEDAQLTI